MGKKVKLSKDVTRSHLLYAASFVHVLESIMFLRSAILHYTHLAEGTATNGAEN